MKKRIISFFVSIITSHQLRDIKRYFYEIKRRITGGDHVVIFYFRIQDPHSYLLLQKIPEFCERFPDIKVQPKIFWDLPSELYPEPYLLQDFSMIDASRVAEYHGLKFDSNSVMPPEEMAFSITRILLAIEDRADFISIALTLSDIFWCGNDDQLKEYYAQYEIYNFQKAIKLLNYRRANFVEEGHYLSAILNYGGEWYWGVDRLPYLVDRLTGLGLSKEIERQIEENLEKDLEKDLEENNGILLTKNSKEYGIADDQLSKNILPKPSVKKKSPLIFYFSFRSPYSYIAIQRTIDLAEKYDIELVVKPVLPMVMRGLSVPFVKRHYIVMDTKRETETYSIPFGKMCDPLGKGAENCLAIYQYALVEGKHIEYLLSVSKGIWAEGADVAKENDLKKLVDRAGLNWIKAKTYLQDRSWQHWAEEYRSELYSLGLWGVPCFKYGDEVFWGQDRLWAVEKSIIAGYRYQP